MVQSIHTINAATATAVGQPIEVGNAKAISFVFKRSAHSSGSTAFTVEVSFDSGTTWIAYAKLISNVANTNAQTLTRVASVSLTSNTTVLYTMEPEAITHVRVTATETTDGTHDAWVLVKV